MKSTMSRKIIEQKYTGTEKAEGRLGRGESFTNSTRHSFRREIGMKTRRKGIHVNKSTW